MLPALLPESRALSREVLACALSSLSLAIAEKMVFEHHAADASESSASTSVAREAREALSRCE
jgi:hypothetical protein